MIMSTTSIRSILKVVAGPAGHTAVRFDEGDMLGLSRTTILSLSTRRSLLHMLMYR